MKLYSKFSVLTYRVSPLTTSCSEILLFTNHANRSRPCSRHSQRRYIFIHRGLTITCDECYLTNCPTRDRLCVGMSECRWYPAAYNSSQVCALLHVDLSRRYVVHPNRVLPRRFDQGNHSERRYQRNR